MTWLCLAAAEFLSISCAISCTWAGYSWSQSNLGPIIFTMLYRGKWLSGEVAIRLFKPELSSDRATLESFKKDVAIYRRTRHENLVLFVGACMDPPNLAIVTSLCKGKII